MSRYQASAARARSRASRVVGEHDLLLHDEKSVRPEDLPGSPRVLDRDEERVRAERLLRREPQHRRAQRREDARHGRPCHAGAVRADERVVVHGVEEGAHRGDGRRYV